MGPTYDNPSAWARIDSGLKDALIIQTLSTLECVICLEVMHVPFLCACGHSFCYACLAAWLKNKLNCPTCRTDLKDPPVLNIHLRDISRAFTNLFIESLEDTDQAKVLKDTREEQILEFERKALLNKDLFGKSFLLLPVVVDSSDGVARCGNCHWEAHGSVCLHCGARIRDPQNSDYYDSESGDAYDEDEQEVELYGAEGGAYDTQDSFVDVRDISEINQDSGTASELDTDDLQDDNVWTGFRPDTEMYRHSDGLTSRISLSDELQREWGPGAINSPIDVPSDSAGDENLLIEMDPSSDADNLTRTVDRIHRNHILESDYDSDDIIQFNGRFRSGGSRGTTGRRQPFTDDDS